MVWHKSWRFDKDALPLADRHYNRQKVGSPQFVPPGRCVVLLNQEATALWVTSWQFSQYAHHDWAGAWVNSLFRKECPGLAHEFILQAIAATRANWPEVPEQGIVTFIDTSKVPPIRRRGKDVWGYCYLKAGFKLVGRTKKRNYLAFQLLPGDMPEPQEALPRMLTDERQPTILFECQPPQN